MATLKTKFTVGLFVIIGLAMSILLIIWLGMSHYFEEGQFYLAYFDESVQGLDKDSPVKYRGVAIGRVHNINVAPDANLIQVLLKIETDIRLDDTIVAQLKSVGITGIMFVELDKIGKSDPTSVQRIDFPTKYPVINTKSSDIKQFFDTVSEVLLQFKNLDIASVSETLKTTLAKIDGAIDDAHVKELSAEIQTALEQIQLMMDTRKWEAAMANLNGALKAVRSMAATGRETASNLNAAIERMDRVMESGRKDIGPLIAEVNTSAKELTAFAQSGTLFVSRSNQEVVRLMSQLSMALQHYEKAGKNLNRFLEQIADQPSRLLFAEPPERAEIETHKVDKK